MSVSLCIVFVPTLPIKLQLYRHELKEENEVCPYSPEVSTCGEVSNQCAKCECFLQENIYSSASLQNTVASHFEMTLETCAQFDAQMPAK